jgi:hypothetical protein
VGLASAVLGLILLPEIQSVKGIPEALDSQIRIGESNGDRGVERGPFQLPDSLLTPRLRLGVLAVWAGPRWPPGLTVPEPLT